MVCSTACLWTPRAQFNMDFHNLLAHDRTITVSKSRNKWTRRMGFITNTVTTTNPFIFRWRQMRTHFFTLVLAHVAPMHGTRHRIQVGPKLCPSLCIHLCPETDSRLIRFCAWQYQTFRKGEILSGGTSAPETANDEKSFNSHNSVITIQKLSLV